MKEGRVRVVHGIDPVFDRDSRVLILGSLPSVKSREQGFFYAHPQNRFWRLLAGLFGEKIPETVEEKKTLLLTKRVALWDTVKSCDISGSSDASIKNAVPNDLSPILSAGDIRAIFCNGAASFRLYEKLQLPLTGRDAALLPSTSPANAAWDMERLAGAWSVIKAYL
ncbi:MAG: DNA-deoxyinosine glycosylase [Clostridia bacterium]|nr:DNA-deoxyinosine glycosylase [Clostridia bacterium]